MKTLIHFLSAFIFWGLHAPLLAQEVFNGDTLVVRFDGWTGVGFAPESTVGRIDSRSWIINGLTDGSMDFGDTKLGGDFGRGVSSGRVTTGGVYAFTPAAGVRLLGFQPTGTDLAPGSATFKVRFPNRAASTGVVVDYDLWVYNDQDRSTLIELEWSIDGVTFQPATGGGTFTPAAAEVGVLWRKHSVSGFLATNEIEADSFLFIRWVIKDGAGSGSRDEWGLEQIRISVINDSTIGPPVPVQTVIAYDFDEDTDIPTQKSIDQFDARFGLVGANRIGFLTGSPGRAANSNGWNQLNSAWYLRFSTVGFSNIYVQSKQYSSPTGPKIFSLEWSADSISWKFLSTIEVGGTFVNIQPDRGIPLPEDAGNKPRVLLRWRLSSGISVGGGAISSTGTSRIDEISVTGIPTDPILPIFSSVQIDDMGDQIVGTALLSSNGSQLISTVELKCAQVDGDSLLTQLLPTVVRSTIFFKTGSLPQPSKWNCNIYATSEVGTSATTTVQVIVEPPPLPYAQKPTVQAKDIQLVARTDSSMHIRWQRGDGEFSMLAILQPGEERCLTDTSATYSTHPNFNFTSTTRNGCKVVWSGTGNQAFVYGFSPLQSELFTVLEFNGEPGRENYLEDGQERIEFKTRAAVPDPIEHFRPLLVTEDRVVFAWTPSVTGVVHVLIVDDLPTTNVIVDYLDGKSPAETVLDTGCTTAPCTIMRGDLGDKKIIALTVNGPLGHQSIQLEPYEVWEPSWPDPTIGRLLAEWSFEATSNVPSWSVWEHQGVHVSIIGARDRGYAAGFVGMASYADQWHEPSISKSWEISLTTHALASASVEFRVISSASGPGRFKVVCDVSGTMYTSSQVVSSSATWALTTKQRVEIPSECLDQPKLRLLVTPDGDNSLSGNRISRTGTSRIDEIRLYGTYLTNAAPLLDDVKLRSNDDNGITLMGRWISAAGLLPTRQSIKVVSASGETDFFFPVEKLTDTFELDDLAPSTLFGITHCGYLESSSTCSKPLNVITPHAIPEPVSIASHALTGLDSVEVIVHAHRQDIVVFYGLASEAPPTLVDSLAVLQQLPNGLKVIPRQSSLKPVRINGLRPGSSYRFWVVAVSGPDSLARYSRSPHSFTDISIPKLVEPELPAITIITAKRDFQSVRFQLDISDNANVLFTLTADSDSPVSPIDDETYTYGGTYSQGDRLGNETYVVGDVNDGELRIAGLPLGKKWRLRLYSLNTLNGAITYSKSYHDHIFATLPDPVANPMSAHDVWTSDNGDTLAISGILLWKSSDQLLVQLQDGNVLFSSVGTDGSSLKLNRRLALLGIKKEPFLQLVTHLHDDTDEQIVSIPYVLHPDTTNVVAMRQSHLIIGNVIETGQSCADGRPMYRQRGANTRKMCLLTTEKLPQKGSVANEWSVTGFPVYDKGSSHLTIIVGSNKDMSAYVPQKSVLILPNKDQLITWTTSDDTEIEFKWEYSAAIRPFDQFPDSVQSDAFFITKIPSNRIVMNRLLKNGEYSMKLKASELHRLHSVGDSLQLGTDLEWTVAIHTNVDASTRELASMEWIPFRLLRLKALYDTDVMDVPNAFKLDQARPNPFNPSTVLRIYIPKSDELDIQMYDVLGRRVKEIHSGTIRAGVHDLVVDAGRLSSGVYIIQARYMAHTVTQRVTLVK